MSDSLSSRLEMLRFLERVQLADLHRTRRWITETERAERELQQGAAARPPAPDWLLQVGIGTGAPPVAVHAGGCAVSGKRLRPLGRDQAIRALTEGVTACTLCRPDTELGVLE